MESKRDLSRAEIEDVSTMFLTIVLMGVVLGVSIALYYILMVYFLPANPTGYNYLFAYIVASVFAIAVSVVYIRTKLRTTSN